MNNALEKLEKAGWTLDYKTQDFIWLKDIFLWTIEISLKDKTYRCGRSLNMIEHQLLHELFIELGWFDGLSQMD